MPYRIDEAQCRDLEKSSRLEWMLPNGIGGFAMGTVSGINTRRYHGHLVAAVRAPTERMLLLATVEASVQAEGSPIWLSANQYPGAVFPEGYRYLESFEVDGAAIWSYRSGAIRVVKRLSIHPGRNACTLEYKNAGTVPIQLILRPLAAHRTYHAEFFEHPRYPERLEFPKNGTEIDDNGVKLVLSHPDAQRMPVQGWYYRFEHVREFERGLEGREDLFCPCELRYELSPGESAVLVASEGEAEEPIEHAPEPPSAGSLGEMLRTEARKFIVSGSGRTSILAGYPWFTDWGRDAMISLPGVCLATGEIKTARRILRDFAGAMRDGLIPNRFVDADAEPEYNTVDATLWFANAVWKTLAAEWDDEFAFSMRQALADAYAYHLEGTRYGIKVDPEDGLLSQGEAGVQLTWMDAKIDGWVVTPRHGKPVEIAGLWVNFLRILAALSERLDLDGSEYTELADRAEASFETKFWCAGRGHYFDTVDPYDASLRPNQVIAMALEFGPARGENAILALSAVERELLTPVGLRTLGPNEPGYRGRFWGSLADLDAAYHQGTVWPWLLGPYISALVRLTGNRVEARQVLRHAKSMLLECGIGGISECYDGDSPHRPGGCPWQAWSVAEVLRAWVEDAKGD